MTDGYDAPDIADLVVRKTEAVRNDPRRIEDFIPPDALQPTLVAVAAAGERVLDFGGAAGFHYLTAARAYPERALRWAGVEHPVTVERAKRLEGENLRFFSAIDDAMQWLAGIDLLHSNGAPQCLDAPASTLERLFGVRAPDLLSRRTLLRE